MCYLFLFNTGFPWHLASGIVPLRGCFETSGAQRNSMHHSGWVDKVVRSVARARKSERSYVRVSALSSRWLQREKAHGDTIERHNCWTVVRMNKYHLDIWPPRLKLLLGQKYSQAGRGVWSLPVKPKSTVLRHYMSRSFMSCDMLCS